MEENLNMPPTKNILDKQIFQYEEFPLLELTSSHPTNFQRNTPNQYDSTMETKWAKDLKKNFDPKKVKLPLVLSAANTYVKGSGRLDVVSCRNVFPTNPTIEFINDRTDHFGGEISIWLEGLKGGEQLQFIIRMTGYSSGGAQVKIGASYPTQFSLVEIPVSGSMNLTLGNTLLVPAQTTGGLGLITLRVQFNNAQYGSWLFWDVKIKDLNAT